ncbi:MAG: hypothetical protein IPL20_17775 [Saprospiraceae bacterium]|nr:hypothetical protein [Saprospiraceae bacterium]
MKTHYAAVELLQGHRKFIYQSDQPKNTRSLVITLCTPDISDPDLITRKVTEHFIGRPISDEQHETAVLYLKEIFLKTILKTEHGT